MRRKPTEGVSLPADLVDPQSWPRCDRWDGKTQPCSCWCVNRRREWQAAGNNWPGGPAQELEDLIALQQQFECNEPWDQGRI
jgi:hypothetical protein